MMQMLTTFSFLKVAFFSGVTEFRLSLKKAKHWG